MSHSGSSSPDPITLASSPLAPHSARRTSVKRPSAPSPNKYSSPSKSFVLETGTAEGASPWRIKVTVEAAPKDESPSRNARANSVKVPLKGIESSSPAKTSGRPHAEAGEAETKRPHRQKKATPIRRTREARSPPAPSPMRVGDAPAVPSSTRKPSAERGRERGRERERARRRRSFQTLPKQRGKRLSQARDELDHALKDALGYDEAGDMTMMHEDFTMVSVATLQSIKADTSVLSHRNDGDRSAWSVSYLPSSPPKHDMSEVRPAGSVPARDTPNNEAHEAEAEATTRNAKLPTETYDVMSWQPTGAARNEAGLGSEQRMRETQTRAWQKEGEEVSRQIKRASPGRVVRIDDDYSLSDDEPEAVLGAEGAEEQKAEAEDRHAEDDDLWQEEASRSLEDESEQHQPRSRRQRRRAEEQKSAQHEGRPESLTNIFGTGPVKPPRAKIPRTWRRTSGMDFQYSDSPARVEPLDVPKKRDHSTGGESRASSGVLTPPSTGDEAERDARGGQEGGRDTTDASFTRPDAVASRIEQAPDNAGDLSISEEDTSPDADDTGLFWQSNMPQVYRRPQQRPRPQRQQRAMDLSELLGLGKDSSPAKPVTRGEALTSAQAQVSSSPNSRQSLRTRPVDGKVNVNTTKLINSPLRKSLLKSSKLHGGSPVASSSRSGDVSRHDASFQSGDQSTTAMESFASKESDQRQLLGEMAVEQVASQKRGSGFRQRNAPSEHISEDEDDSFDHDHDMQEYEEEEYDEESRDQDEPHHNEPSHSSLSEHTPHEPSRSYEERLNLDSPTKIKVHFNDSSSLLHPHRSTKPLTNPPTPHSPPTITLVAKQQPPPTLLSRLTTTFWSAVMRPTGPTSLPPPPLTPEPIFPPSLRAHIRSRYGVLPSTHPWTMQHMRTLHRMLNSTTSHKPDSIIPVPGSSPLPSHLRHEIGRAQTSITGYRYIFTAQHAHVVDCLMQVLVPRRVVDAMRRGEVEALGDEVAESYRGELGDGRWGGDLVWRPPVVQPSCGAVTWEWVVRCLGDVLVGKEGCAEKRRRAGGEV
ncbi:hypothetical protein EJ03DRAFT_123592 [Teratosphaeria nubilosa]|uniref:Uncharacterized protein n=1 Tax=Teratosphaeria nubilosa TaxID=161662 RepID=A0A6G1LLA0_9PEZI|nr:hypothetical protein EJ03DRAFT_123592 [Teratosphaeria nubilosa]